MGSTKGGWCELRNQHKTKKEHRLIHVGFALALSFCSCCLLLSSISGWGFQVGSARKKYKVPYPTLYAIESENKDAKLFNCVQRGHQNSLEMMPVFFLLMVLGGIRHPCVCASLGSLYIVTRYFYFSGYATGDPKNRLNIGKYGFLALMGLIGCTISFGISLLRG
ncbi:MICROSOMAL GLUTATHIONE S-TRANSFERASE [Salix viminalis]|uniref:Glutathione S-transferase 3, mitochondrial n=2 Tax=Salix TaxID=40685 RepID=A0A9Q0QIW9_SALVM|nr:MICROSOMAL GLUTATHIONE S-TRANSFERASE [Salix viminalis]